jgi:hypothetical protein
MFKSTIFNSLGFFLAHGYLIKISAKKKSYNGLRSQNVSLPSNFVGHIPHKLYINFFGGYMLTKKTGPRKGAGWISSVDCRG